MFSIPLNNGSLHKSCSSQDSGRSSRSSRSPTHNERNVVDYLGQRFPGNVSGDAMAQYSGTIQARQRTTILDLSTNTVDPSFVGLVVSKKFATLCSRLPCRIVLTQRNRTEVRAA